MEQLLDNFYSNLLYEIADNLINVSPVDTGNYITSFEVTQGRPTAETTSEGKPRGQPWEPFAEEGRAKLKAQIASLPEVTVADKVYFINRAEYAKLVETYSSAPFTHVANIMPIIIQDAAQRSL